MQNITKKINNKSIIGELKCNGKVFYVDVDKTIYSEVDGKYEVVKDRETLQRILDYISPNSMDLDI